MPHRGKGGALVSLLERVCLGDACHQRDRQCDDILLAVGEGVSRARQGAFEKAAITQRSARSPVSANSSWLCSMTASIGSHCGSFGKGGSDLWIAADDFAAQSQVDRPRLLPAGRAESLMRPSVALLGIERSKFSRTIRVA